MFLINIIVAYKRSVQIDFVRDDSKKETKKEEIKFEFKIKIK